MVRRRPRWAWYPRELVQQRVGASSVFGDRPTFDVSLYGGLLVDRSAIWAELFGAWSRLHRALLRRVWWRHFRLGVLLHHKLDPGFGLGSDLRLLRVLPRYFWWMPGSGWPCRPCSRRASFSGRFGGGFGRPSPRGSHQVSFVRPD